MIITRETDYAVRILRSLGNQRLKNIREISDEQFIPRQFAYKISKKLERAGYIEIVRGAQGGCRIVRDLKNITLMDLIKAMDRENMLSICLDAECECLYRKQNKGCGIYTSFEQIQSDLDHYFSSFSLHEVVWGDCKKKFGR